MRNFFKLVFIVAIAGSIFSCNQEKKESDQSNESPTALKEILTEDSNPQKSNPDYTTFSHLIEKQEFKLNTSEPFESVTAHGMKIKIPANSLTDQEGNPVSGEVKVSVKEYYTPAEIILSGITMDYKDGNEIKHLESDGMFTITAEQEGKELKVAKGKSISLETKKSSTQKGFAFFGLANNRLWVKDTSTSVASSALPVLQKPASPHIPAPLVKFNPNFYTVESDDRQLLPEKGQGNKYPNHTVTQINIDVRKNKWILNRKKWKIDKDKFIIRKRIEGSNKYEKIPFQYVFAVRGNKKYEEFLVIKNKYDKELKAYTDNYKTRSANGQLTATELRALRVANFGTYNIDRYLRFPKEFLVEKDFSIKEPEDLLANARIYLIAKDLPDRTYLVDLTYYPNQLRYLTTEENSLIVIQGEKVYSLDNEEFEAIVEEQKDMNEFNFAMNKVEIKDIKGFDETIASLF